MAQRLGLLGGLRPAWGGAEQVGAVAGEEGGAVRGAVGSRAHDRQKCSTRDVGATATGAGEDGGELGGKLGADAT